MYCLNLPPELRYLPANVFIVGVIPGISSPDSVQLWGIMRLLVDQLKSWWEGKRVETYNYPNGRLIRVGLLANIADLPAIRKLVGFYTTAGSYMCSFCLHRREALNDWWADTTFWPLRTGDEVRTQAEVWRDAPSLAQQNRLGSSNGVRWVPLYLLPYFDPVKHTVLGFMHGLLTGIAQTQLRDIYRIGERATRSGIEQDDVLIALEIPFAPRPSGEESGTEATASDAGSRASSRLSSNTAETDGNEEHEEEREELVNDSGDSDDDNDSQPGQRPAARGLKQAKPRRMRITRGEVNELHEEAVEKTGYPLPPVNSYLRSGQGAAGSDEDPDRTIQAGDPDRTIRPETFRSPPPSEPDVYDPRDESNYKELRWIEAIPSLFDLYSRVFDPEDSRPASVEPETSDRAYIPPLDRSQDPGLLTPSDIAAILACLAGVHFPTWLPYLPKNLGEKQHGKLKAYEHFILFTVVFPLILPELKAGQGDTALLFLLNFHALVAVINIVSAYTTDNDEANACEYFYREYIETLQQITPETFTAKDNFHMGIHYPDQLRWWGPLGSLSEFSGERLQGILKQGESSGRMGKLQRHSILLHDT